jgi:hypothetical protein
MFGMDSGRYNHAVGKGKVVMEDLEPVRTIAEREFPEEVEEIRNRPVQHIDADRTLGKTDWDRECQESRRLNRR